VFSKLTQYLALAASLTILPLAAAAQDKAQLPYSAVNSYLELFSSLGHLDRIIPSMMVYSTNADVTPPDIEFKIKVEDGWQKFSPDENGVIAFTSRPDWADSILISNQPKGTLQLDIGFLASPLSGTSISYQELMGLVPQFEEALTGLSKMQGQPPPKIKGLTIQMPEGSRASVNVLSAKRKATLKPSSAGVVIMKYDNALWEENPPVEFGEMPIAVIPLQ
jgi:hypothetical protein